MKKQIKQLMLLTVLFLSTSLLRAQQMPVIPVDKQVRIGKLENGLSYYIRKNQLPEQRADFYLVQKVGSILEEENERGLAHFLEHMAFNGSKHFPNDGKGAAILPYLESIGVKFGAHLNAYTSIEETVYNITNVPTATVGAIDSCMMILYDWSGALYLREKEIDKERKVVHEEWRTRQSAFDRILEAVGPTIYSNTKYAKRMPIGLMSVIDNFKPNILREYYKKWYRTDLQAIVIVGDIDVDKTEQSLLKLFSDKAKPVNAKERLYESIPDNEAPIVAIATDKEITATQIIVSLKRDAVAREKKTTMDYLLLRYAQNLISKVLDARLKELSQQNDAPFFQAFANDGDFLWMQAREALELMAIANEGNSEKALKTLLQELKRVKDFGLTAGEYERAKANYISQLEKRYNERDKQFNGFFVGQYLNNFLKNEPIPSIEDEYNTYMQILPHINVEVINQIIPTVISDKNLVVLIMGTEKEKNSYPSEAKINVLITEVAKEKLSAYEEKTIDEPLLGTLPKKGKIVKETYDKKRGTTVWTLSNGARVLVKPTNFKDDQILFSLFALGGNSLIDNKYTPEILMMNEVAHLGGLGQFSASNMKKLLAGKNVAFRLQVDDFHNWASGNSTVKDLETFMQVLYLNFTDLRLDTTAYNSFASGAKSMLKNISSNPNAVLTDSLLTAIYMGNARKRLPTVEDIEKIDYPKLLELFKGSFANAGDFTFSFVGNIDLKSFKPLVEQYIGSLPTVKGAKKANYNAKVLAMRKGKFENNFIRSLETSKASTQISYTASLPYNLQEAVLLDALHQIINMECIDKIREEKGGTYGVNVRQEMKKIPEERLTIQLSFDSEPSRREELLQEIYKIIDSLQEKGSKAEHLQKVKEYMLKQHTDNLKLNGYALRNINRYYCYSSDFESNYENYVNALSNESIKKFAKKFFSQGNRIEVSMSSEN